MNTPPPSLGEFEAELETVASELEIERMEPGLRALGHAIGEAWRNLPPSTKQWIQSELRLAIQDTLRGRPQDAVHRAIAILLPQLYPTALQMAAGSVNTEQLRQNIRQLVRATPIPAAVVEQRKGMSRGQVRQYERRQRARGMVPGRNRALRGRRWRESEIDIAATELESELTLSGSAAEFEAAAADLANELGADKSGAEQTEQESVGTISSSDYLKWVQRSLNRLYGIKIPTDGKDSNAYRTALRKFNAEYSGRDYGDVDERTQNDLISVNVAPGRYIAWVIRALNAVGAGPLPVSDAYNSAVVSAIKKFQGRPGLGIKVDGYVGAKTELALIKASALLPPGDGRKAAPNGGHKPSLPKPCNTASGEFLDAIRSFLQKRVPQKPPPGEEPQVLLKLLCSSRSFRDRVRNLNRRYVNLSGKMLDRACSTAGWREKCAVNRDGVLTKGPLSGRTVLEVTSSISGSEFLSTRALDNLYGDRHLLFIDGPPWDSKPAERRGWLIQNIAHEAFHAHRHMNPGSRAAETLRERVSASIDEEIEAREFDKKVVKEIRKTSEGRRLLAGYGHPGKAFFLQTGHLLTDRFVVERDPFPGILNLTYLEQFAMSVLMHAAADSEGLTNNKIQSINKAVDKMRSVELKPFWKGQDAVKNNDTYKELRLLAVHMDKEWTQLGLSDSWKARHERMAQEHACVFRKLVTYTPHPDPAIRRPNCS